MNLVLTKITCNVLLNISQNIRVEKAYDGILIKQMVDAIRAAYVSDKIKADMDAITADKLLPATVTLDIKGVWIDSLLAGITKTLRESSNLTVGEIDAWMQVANDFHIADLVSGILKPKEDLKDIKNKKI